MLGRYILFAIALASNVFASQQTVSDINTLNQKVATIKRSLEGYHGGIPGSLKVARTIYDAHTFSEQARKNMGNKDPFSDDDSARTLDAYNNFYPTLIDTLRVAQVKAPEFKKAGVGYVAQGMMSNLYNEKADFELVMHGQLSSNHSRMVQPSVDDVDMAFKKTLNAFRN